MAQPPSPKARTRRPRLLILWLGTLVLGVGLCYGLYEYSPAGWVFFALTSGDFDKRAQALAPELQRLNDDLLQSLPTYPRATLLPDSRRRWGVNGSPWPPGGPQPPVLHVCFGTNDPLEQVGAYYQDVLEKEGWEVSQERRSDDGGLYREFTKDRGCVVLERYCLSVNQSGAKTVYGITVYHDLNLLLGFPDVPKIMYWLDEVRHCP
jgi:hypothetical protein